MRGPVADRTVAIQLLLPDDYLADKAAAARMRHVAACGFDAVELNILEPERVECAALKAWLAGFGLRMTAFASGAAAKAMNLALSHSDEALRRVSIHRARQFIEFASRMNASVIIGYFKGGPAATREPFVRSLDEIVPFAEDAGVDLIIEATNRYESSLCNRVEETVKLIKEMGSPRLMVLPDTFHMNIEEPNMMAALDAALDHCVSVHLSDNNRFLPGRGGIDFGAIVHHLIGRGFKGVFGLEGNMPDFENDVRDAARYLESLA